MAKKQGGLLGNNYRRLLRVGLMVVVISAKRLVRFSVIGAFGLGLLWLLYANVWQSLRQKAPLSSGVVLDSPHLDVEALLSINAARVARTEWARRDFSTWGGVFAKPGRQSDGGADDR